MFEKTISNLIENQFPDFYKEEGPQFIEFVKAYYSWMEAEGNAIYHSRRLLEYRDIDTTVDDFLIHFKDKYLNNIQFDTAVDTRRIVKHSLDMYRSKGTERSIDLFFKNVFGVKASVYYPSQDIFKTSSGKWIEPKYLELSICENIKNFEGVQIEGVNSGATAFVEKYVRKKLKSKPIYTEIYYISNIVGSFQTGERLKNSFTEELGPVVTGSLNTIDVVDGASGYKIGDIIDVTSNVNGQGGKARVTNVSSVSGKVNFTLSNGGWGYNSDSQILISEKNFLVDDTIDQFSQFDSIYQYYSNVHYNAQTGIGFAVGDIVFRANTTGNVVFNQAKVVSLSTLSNTEGYMTIVESTARFANTGTIFKYDSIPNVNGKFIDFSQGPYTFGNTIATANTIGKIEYAASANLMAMSSNVNIVAASPTGSFQVGGEIFQKNSSNIEVANGYISSITWNNTTAILKLINTRGTFSVSNTNTIISRDVTASANVLSTGTKFGIINSNGSFIQNSSIFYSSNGIASGYLSKISSGAGATFSIVPTFYNTETISLNTDEVGLYANVLLNSNNYGFPAVGAENINTLLSDAFTYVSKDYGKISNIVVKNSGTGYDDVPFVVVYEKDLVKYNKRDFVVNITNISGNFATGEVIQQDGINRGIVKSSSNSSVLFLERITFSEFSNTSIIGLQSGSTANISSVMIDYLSNPVGLNAAIDAKSSFAVGSINAVQVIDSGFGYYDNEPIVLSLGDNITGTGVAHTYMQGSKIGYWKENNSVLSSNKYIQDGDYYQEFSYEISSPIVLKQYSDILKDTMHIAGTKFFANFVFETSIDSSSDLSGITVTIEADPGQLLLSLGQPQ